MNKKIFIIGCITLLIICSIFIFKTLYHPETIMILEIPPEVVIG